MLGVGVGVGTVIGYHTGVCENEKNGPPEEKTLQKKSTKNTESGAGKVFLVQNCSAKVLPKGSITYVADTGIPATALRACLPLARLRKETAVGSGQILMGSLQKYYLLTGGTFGYPHQIYVQFHQNPS